MAFGCSPIPAYMDAGSYPCEYPSLSMGNSSGPPAIPTSNPASFLLESMLDLDGGSSQPYPLFPDLYVDSEAGILGGGGAYSDVQANSAGLCPSLHSTTLSIEVAAETSWDSPLLCPSEMDTVCQATISSGGMSMITPLDHGLQYTEMHTTSDVSTLPVGVPDNSCLPTVAQDQGRESTEILQRSQNPKKGPTRGSSRPHSKSVKAPRGKRRYKCKKCGQGFAQPQGVPRHDREVHNRSRCPSPHCGSSFTWGRRSELKEHLRGQHPDIHLQSALKRATNQRRRETIEKTKHEEGQQALPLSILTLPSSPVPEDVTHVSSPSMSSGASSYNPPPGSTMSISNLARGRELEHLAPFSAAYSPFAFPSAEERGPPPNVPFQV